MNIRNFCIIAHIDHGKSTLADRLLEITKTIDKVKNQQMLDTMDIEQERGITIKLTPARMQRKGYELNLIDTPWHVDFQYEVSRSLAAVEWAVLLVDASQGVQAQTLSVLYAAMDQNLTIIPVLNKIDLPAANPERVAAELEHLIWIDKDEIICVSGKTGENVEAVLDAIIERFPDPIAFQKAHPKQFRTQEPQTLEVDQSRALIFDSMFDPYKWVVVFVKVTHGSFKIGDTLHFINTAASALVTEVGHFTPKYAKDPILSQWQIGYIVTGLKTVREARVWDTILKMKKISDGKYDQYTVPGFKKVKPFVFAWVYPLQTEEYEKLKDAFEKLSMNDSAIQFTYEQSHALGFGFRCGFLWMLHMDIVKERLLREYDIGTIFTTPTVTYLVQVKSKKDPLVSSGQNITDLHASGLYKNILKHLWHQKISEHLHELTPEEKDILSMRSIVTSGWFMPDPGAIETILEPFVTVEIVWPQERSGNIMSLCQDHRWRLEWMDYLDESRVIWKYIMPLGEIVIDFYDHLKSLTKWYASMNYEFLKYDASQLVRLDILINSERMEAFSQIVHIDKAYNTGKNLVEKLKELIPKHMFAIPLQAGIWSKIIARETISAMSKDVLAKCYGWDISRKRKLLEKQKEWKKKMKMMWSVSVPGDIFIKIASR
jgi:GTP-binding protein LepA